MKFKIHCIIPSILIVALFTPFSTPKSTRHGLSTTPAPPASPVLSVDGATPHGIPLVYEKDKPKFSTKYSDTDEPSQPVVAADLEKVCSHLISLLKI